MSEQEAEEEKTDRYTTRSHTFGVLRSPLTRRRFLASVAFQNCVVRLVSQAGDAATATVSSLRSMPVRIIAATMTATQPRTTLPAALVRSIWPRQRRSACREMSPIASRGSAVPSPKAIITAATVPSG
jgi:hypothetical protein